MKLLFASLGIGLLLASMAEAQQTATPARPNIVLIMSDDMGFSDLGCYGGEIATPTLDGLAANGLRFTQFYNTARCCPTRGSLLTGLYPHQAGLGHMMTDQGYDGYRGNLSKEAVTIAEVLKAADYRTYACGKWHVTRFTTRDGDRSNWPLQRGFEKFYGTLHGAGSFYDPSTLCRQNTFITPQNDPEYRPDEYYYTDALSDNAVKFLQEHQQESPEKPFFLYLPYTCAHWPMHALEKDISKYEGKYNQGYQPLREARLAKMNKLGLAAPGTPLSAPAEDWERVKDKRWEARCREVYSAMIDNMDAGIGRLVSQLKSSGQLDNTVIFFLQDNGACAESMGRNDNGTGPANLKPLGDDGLQPKGSPPMQTRDGRWVRTGSDVLAGPADTYIAYGRGWANVSNTPFREYKHWVHEGGISTPLIVHWPQGIAAQEKGKLVAEPGHLIDLMATCVDLSGAKYPQEFAGQKIKPMEGISLAAAFQGKDLKRPSPIFWEHEGNRAVRQGKWKLVAKADEPWELYDIEKDRTEIHDLSSAHPELAKELADAWDAYAARANVLPLGAWNGDRKNRQDKTSFRLKANDSLKRNQAPAVGRRAFTVTAVVDLASNKSNGVVVAQGGAAQGWALYLTDGKPVFVIRSHNGLVQIEGKSLPAGKHTLTAAVSLEGELSLQVDGQEAAAAVAGELLAQKPVDGLQVGRDEGGAVGEYRNLFPFTDTIESVEIQLGGTK